MQDEAATVVPFRGSGALGRAGWDQLRDTAYAACARRTQQAWRSCYRHRVGQEVAALARLGIQPGLLLELAWVVEDLADRGVTFGPGYGPQSGSLLLHLLGLNGIDPVAHDLPFLGFGRELEARRLHLRVAARVEQAELAAALRRCGAGEVAELGDGGVLEVVIGYESGLALTRDMARMAGGLSSDRDCGPSTQAYPWADPEALRLIARGETEGVALLEDDGLRTWLREAVPRSLAEVVQVVVAARDGAPQESLERYMAARHGAGRPPAPHPALQGILAPTGGVWLYREQVVAALARLLGCDLEHAAGVAQRLVEEGSEAREGALSQQLGERLAGGWGLPHARGLYLVRTLRRALGQVADRASVLAEVTEAYRQAYYKAHYPAAFQAARLNRALAGVSADKGQRYSEGSVAGDAACPNRGAVVRLCRQAVRDGLAVLPPDINRSDWAFRALDRETLLFGLGAVARIDREVAGRLLAGRRAGAYRSLRDVVVRGLGGTASAGLVEPLILAGALDGLQRDRWQLGLQLEALCPSERAWQYAANGVATPCLKKDITAFGGALPGPGWTFQRELDVLGCVPSRQYFPEAAPVAGHLRLVR